MFRAPTREVPLTTHSPALPTRPPLQHPNRPPPIYEQAVVKPHSLRYFRLCRRARGAPLASAAASHVAEWGSGGELEGNPWGLMGSLQSKLPPRSGFLFPWRVALPIPAVRRVQPSIRDHRQATSHDLLFSTHASFKNASCELVAPMGGGEVEGTCFRHNRFFTLSPGLYCGAAAGAASLKAWPLLSIASITRHSQWLVATSASFRRLRSPFKCRS